MKNDTVLPYTSLPKNKFYADSSKPAEQRAEDVLNEMTFEEKARMIGGLSDFYISGIKRLGIPQLYLSDGPQGVHIRPEINTNMDKSTAFPCTLALAATFNPSLAERYACSIGRECRAGAIAFLLGPGMNIYRDSRCGRNFEYFGEDPHLASCMVQVYVKAVQSVGVAATLKHFICNQNEYCRKKCNARVSERALHEIYLPAFKAGVDANAAAVMTSYNLVNGEWSGQSKYVIDELLRDELGFDGLVMSDWASVWHPEKYMSAKLDLKMPDGPDAKIIRDLIEEGRIEQADLDRKVKSILTTCFERGFYDRSQYDENMLGKFPEHNEIALKTAQESIVLLENRNQLLPVDEKDINSVVLIGKDSKKIAAGDGSGFVKGYGHITLFEAVKKKFGDKFTYLANISNAEEEKKIKQASLVLVCVATKNAEGFEQSFFLSDIQDGLIKKSIKLNKNTVVVMMNGSNVRMTDWNRWAGAILYCWYGGQRQGEAIVDVITGRVNPSGKLPITIEKEYSDSPGFGYFPEEFEPEKGNGNRDNIYNVDYNEGIFIGYRWYDKKGIEPLYPFGYGLSYTSFEYSSLEIKKEINGWKISFKVTNVGKRSGAETAQLYIMDVESSLPRPLKELKGFKKVFLDPGGSETIEMTITNKDLSFYDVGKGKWVTEHGIFKVLAAGSSSDIRLTKELIVEN